MGLRSPLVKSRREESKLKFSFLLMAREDPVCFSLISIVELAVTNGSLESKLVCPPLPENVKDIELPISGSKPQAVVSQ